MNIKFAMLLKNNSYLQGCGKDNNMVQSQIMHSEALAAVLYRATCLMGKHLRNDDSYIMEENTLIMKRIVFAIICMIGNGVVIDPKVLLSEIDGMEEKGISTKKSGLLFLIFINFCSSYY